MKYLTIVLIFITSNILAKPHHQGKLSSVNLGIRYSSLLAKRGLIFYDDFQIDPVLGLFFWDDRVEFLGDSLSFRDFVESDRLRIRTRLQAFSDNPLFPAHSGNQSKFDRKDSVEWITSAEVFLPGYNENYRSEIDFNFAKDIQEHWGHYFDLVTKIKLGQFRVFDTLLEPNFVGSYGFGDAVHNFYLYGESKSGIANSSVGFWMAFPEEADRYFPIIQFQYFSTHGLSRESYGALFSFIATMGLLE